MSVQALLAQFDSVSPKLPVHEETEEAKLPNPSSFAKPPMSLHAADPQLARLLPALDKLCRGLDMKSLMTEPTDPILSSAPVPQLDNVVPKPLKDGFCIKLVSPDELLQSETALTMEDTAPDKLLLLYQFDKDSPTLPVHEEADDVQPLITDPKSEA